MASQQKTPSKMRSILSKIFILSGLCGFMMLTATTTLERWSSSRDLVQLSKQPLDDKSNPGLHSILEVIDLDKEWESILGNGSDLDFLDFGVRGI